MNTNPSQATKILQRLTATGGIYVAMPELAQFSGAYAVHSRIAELRKRGHVIENRTQKAKDGTRLSWYRLVAREEEAA